MSKNWGKEPRAELERSFPAVGTFVEVSLWSEVVDEEGLFEVSHHIKASFEESEQAMSFYRAESELSRVNARACDQAVKVSGAFAELLGWCLDLARRSGGAFDPAVGAVLQEEGLRPGRPKGVRGSWRDVVVEGRRVRFLQPVQLDFGGVAKGWAVDQAVARLPEGVEGVVNAGGDLRATAWEGQKVMLREFLGLEAEPGGMELLAPALAVTSPCNFGQGNDLVDPVRREIVRPEVVVGVFAPSCRVADALTKVVGLGGDCEELLAHYGAVAQVWPLG